MWIFQAIFSSILLGGYDLLKKSSLKNNAFIPVLFFATLTGGIAFVFLTFLSSQGVITADNIFFVPEISSREHLLYFLKACLVGSSWYFAYMALSNLPITIVVPIRSTGPIWTVTGAALIYSEHFNVLQWFGIILAIVSSYLFAIAGKKEGIKFHKNKWVFAIMLATILGSISSLFDKYLMQQYNRMAIQAWFSMYMVVVMLPFLFFAWFPKRKEIPLFQWRWTIPAIGLVLILADFLYFYSLSNSGALIGIVSVIRRSSVLVSFTLGAVIFREGNIRSKALALFGILVAVVFLVLGS